ncbi:hypothetical protein SO802_006804 [Lithocarpus litseifolius]|uniref:RNase H type-1 domain-containing protein n=1 Tax=Lithocarpus litseifolius TaxID=425828 RepID=A0AAW2DMR7_9ROSI
MIKDVWDSRFASLPSQFFGAHNYADLLNLFLSSNFDTELFAMTSWELWTRRNKVRVGEMAKLINRVVEEARKQLQEFLRSRPNPKKKMRKTKTVWKPPDLCSVKINYDGAMFEDINAVGIGVVAQNDRGEVFAAMTERIPIPDSVLVLETLAARRAVQFAHEVGFLNSIFEGDSETSIKAIRNQTSLHSSFGHIIIDIWSSISSF